MMNEDVNLNENKSVGMEETTQVERKRKRMYWLDWVRTQSVWNVICGHILWSVWDQTNLTWENVMSNKHTESTRMLIYVENQGSFHTVPMFFLVSGYLASKSFKLNNNGLRRFFYNRCARITPPWIFGTIYLAIALVAQGEQVSILKLLMSYLWFMWALLIVQTVAMPFCVMVRLLVQEKVQINTFTIATVLHIVVITVVNIFASYGLSVNESGWLVAIPISTIITLFLLWAPGTSGHIRNILKVISTIWIASSTFFAATHPVCPLPGTLDSTVVCGRFDMLTKNLFQAILIIFHCYLAGFCASEVEPYAKDLFSRVAKGISVMVLLLSLYWPYFTYWGPNYIRENAFLKTYQSAPSYNLWDIESKVTNIDSAMAGTNAPAWAITRMWFWIGALLLFAKGFCDHPVIPFIHRHITQSGIVLFILHRPIIIPLIKALYKSGITEPFTLAHTTILLIFIICIVLYTIIISNPIGRAVFGVISVDFAKKSKKICECCPGTEIPQNSFDSPVIST